MDSSAMAFNVLRSALKKRISFNEPVVINDNFIDLVEYPGYYSLMVLNFPSCKTKHIENNFIRFIQERKRRDIFVITMQEIDTFLQSKNKEPIHLERLAEEEEEEEGKEPQDIETICGYSINLIVAAIKEKIDAAVQENDRILEQRQVLSKFNILNRWRTGDGVSEEVLTVVKENKKNSVENNKNGSNKKKPQKEKPQKEKPKKSRKSKTDVSSTSQTQLATATNPNSVDDFTYVIPEYDFTTQIWSRMTQRGQLRYDKTYIEDFPVMGPKLYIILLNFSNITLMKQLIQNKLNLNTVMQVRPFGINDDSNTLNLIDMSARRLDIFKPVSFFDHYIIVPDKPITCYTDRMNAYNLICYMLYDAEDIRSKYGNFLTNCSLQSVEDNINVVVVSSEREYLLSNVIEFYLIDLFKQIDVGSGEEENDDDNGPFPTPTPPIVFRLFDNRITVVENCYNFLKMNQSLKNVDALSAMYFNYITNWNKLYFDRCPQTTIIDYDFQNVKFVKCLTKYAFNEIVFELNSSCNKMKHYEIQYYKILDKKYRIVCYKYYDTRSCVDEVCYQKIVVPTPLCHRDFNEFLYDEIQPWLAKQEFLYNDLVQNYLYEKYLESLPKHIEFKIKYVKENDFIFEPSIKMERHLRRQQQFEMLKLKEYDKIFEYLDRKNTEIAKKSFIKRVSSNMDSSDTDFETSSRKSKKSKKISIGATVSIDDNVVDLVEYPKYYSLMVLNFASNITQNVENIFNQFIEECKRRDIIVITMQGIEKYLTAMHRKMSYDKVSFEETEEEEQEVCSEEGEEEVGLDKKFDGPSFSTNEIVMTIKEKIDAAIRENDRITEQREALAKFRILEYWANDTSLSEESLPIVNDKKRDSIKSDEKQNENKKGQKQKLKKSKKSKSDLSIELEESKVPTPNGIDEFTYIIPEYDFTNEIWSKMTQRGQNRFEKSYIEDNPVAGPKIYVILLNFTDINLMEQLIEEKLYLNSIIQVLPFGTFDSSHTRKLIDMSARRLDIFKSVSFFDHYIAVGDKRITCYTDRLKAYQLICYMFYDAEDIRRQYENFLANCIFFNLSDEIRVMEKICEPRHEFILSNVVEFYLIDLFNQIYDGEEEEENECDNDNPPMPAPPPPIAFRLFDNRIVVVENSYNFLKQNYMVKNFDILNAIYFNYITNLNSTYFDYCPKVTINEYDFEKVKFVKYLTKYAFNEIIFQLNSMCYNEVNKYCSDYYKIMDGEYRIVYYKYYSEKQCNDKVCYQKIVVPTPLCHRDFKDFLYDEIKPWLEKQELIYNDLVQDYLNTKYLASLPKHIEFIVKYVKDNDFIFEPSIKMQLNVKRQHQFESMKLKEYDKITQYLEHKNSEVTQKKSLSFSINNKPDNFNVGKKSKKSKTGSKTFSIVDDNEGNPPRPSIKNHRISEVQPFQDLNDDPSMVGVDFNFFRHHLTVVEEEKRPPIKAFNVYDLGDTRYQIDITNRKFNFKNGDIRYSLEDLLYKEKYQSIKLRYCMNQFYLDRIFLADTHTLYLTNYVRAITENGTIINFHINEKFVEEIHTGWTPSYTTSSSSTSNNSQNDSDSLSKITSYVYNISMVVNWPNGLKIQFINDDEQDEYIVEQEWCEGAECCNENKRWYFQSGCCVAFGLDFVIRVYTPHGILYEIGDASEEEETVELSSDSLGDDYEKLENKYEFELNYLSFLSNFIEVDQFNFLLPNGCKIFVQSGKIVKYLSKKPDKLLVKEHMDYVSGEIIIRREDGFKMLISLKEQIVIYPDGTIIKTDQLEQVEHLVETSYSDISFGKCESDLMAKGKCVVSTLLNQVIKFSTLDHFQLINRKSFYFFNENYSTIQWHLETNHISLENYDKSINIVYNNGVSITGSLKNNCTGEFGHDNIENLKFHFDRDHMTLNHKDFSSTIHFHYKDYDSNHILMSTLDHNYLNRMVIMCDGREEISKNLADNCVYKYENPIKELDSATNHRDRIFLICENNDDHYFELVMDDVKCDPKDHIVKDDDGNILVLNDLNAEMNSSFKGKSNLFAQIPDRLATKPDNLCKLEDDTLEIHEKQIKKNIFNKLSNRYGFEYYQKYDNKLLKNCCCDDNQMEKLCENAINYYVDQEYQRLIDEREAKKNRLKPSAAFYQKMKEIDMRHQLAENYKYMLRYKVIPNYFEFHEHGDHIKYMDVSKYVKKLPRIRYHRDTKTM